MGAADVKAKRKMTKVVMGKIDIAFIIRQLELTVQVYQSVFGVGGLCSLRHIYSRQILKIEFSKVLGRGSQYGP